jgi:hypothetical protein
MNKMTYDPKIRERYVADVPTSKRPLAEKAFAGACSPRAAIKAKCLGCVGYEIKEITYCTSATCELYAFRPFQPASEKTIKRAPRGAAKHGKSSGVSLRSADNGDAGGAT